MALFLEKFTPLAKILSMPPAVTAWTNLTSASITNECVENGYCKYLHIGEGNDDPPFCLCWAQDFKFEKIVVLQIPRVAKTNLSFVKMTFLCRDFRFLFIEELKAGSQIGCWITRIKICPKKLPEHVLSDGSLVTSGQKRYIQTQKKMGNLT